LGLAEVGLGLSQLGLSLPALRLDLRPLRLRLRELGCRLIDALLIIDGAHNSEFGVFFDLVSRLNVAQAAVRTAQLINPFDEARRLEREVDLGYRSDGRRIAFR